MNEHGHPANGQSNDEQICVVIVAFESGEVTRTALQSVRNAIPDAEIVVVDNASQRAPVSSDVVEESAARLFASAANVGFGRACNRGARSTGRRYILFLNPDAELVSVPVRLDALRDNHGRLGMVAPKPLPDEAWSHGLAAESGCLRDILSALLTPYWPRSMGRPAWSVRRGSDWASGSCVLVDRREFLELGGFDEQFFFLFEDRELGWRYRRGGYPVQQAEGFACRHEVGTSVSADPRHKEVLRRYLGLLALIEYWRATRAAVTASRLGTVLLQAHRALTALSGAVAAVAPRSTRWATKVSIEREIAARLRQSVPIEGSLQFSSAVARAVYGRAHAPA